ncbi:MAG: molybdenum cofactor guanylyltransferase [Actinomycetota bacterium]
MTDWLILAGGSGSRLGQDKAATPLDGRTLLDRARATIDSVDEEATIHVLDQAYTGGPAAAVVAGLARCKSAYVGVLAVDMPFAADALVHVLSAVAGQPAADAWVPVDGTGRRQWLCAVYRSSALATAADSCEEWSGRSFASLVGQLACVDVPIDDSISLLDIDTPDDLRRARERTTHG